MSAVTSRDAGLTEGPRHCGFGGYLDMTLATSILAKFAMEHVGPGPHQRRPSADFQAFFDWRRYSQIRVPSR